MEFSTLLNRDIRCACGRTHRCDLRVFRTGSGVLDQLPQALASYRRIYLLSDIHTEEAAGRRVRALLGDRIIASHVWPDGHLVPDEAAERAALENCPADADFVLAVGSGVLNDLGKYTSYTRGIPCGIVATAPSMDGYASVGAAMITSNMKTTFGARVPAAIIGDVDVLKDAPMRMIQSGFGDIIGKYSALNDWKLAHLINGETLCQRVYQLVMDTVKKTEALAGGIEKRDPQAIQTLMEALVIVGIAMSFVGNSRPASGSEHHLSHYFEIVGILEDKEYFLHGIDVAYSTVRTQLMREKLLQMTQLPESVPEYPRSAWEQDIRSRYGIAAEGVMALQDKCGFYAKDYLSEYRAKWGDIREILAEVPSAEEIIAILKTAGLDYSEFEPFYGEKKILDAEWFAKDLKDRYTVLWPYFLLCFPRQGA